MDISNNIINMYTQILNCIKLNIPCNYHLTIANTDLILLQYYHKITELYIIYRLVYSFIVSLRYFM